MDRLRSVVLRRCKSLSRAGSRRSSSSSSSSYSNLRSMSARDDVAGEDSQSQVAVEGASAVVFVGSSRRRYVISARHLRHPLIAALIDDDDAGDGDVRNSKGPVAVRCEVVLFDHLLWMLDNAVDLRAGAGGEDDAVRELVQLYAT